MANSTPSIKDYKPTNSSSRASLGRVPWFIAGLGIPLICLAFILPDSDEDQAPQRVAAVEEAPEEIGTAEPTTTDTPVAPQSAAAAAAPAMPEGEPITLTVKRGDSLDRLFRRNDLSVADLTVLMRDELARKHLRIVRPGDELEIRHIDGDIMTIGRELNISESLLVSRTDDGFESRIIERELEVRPIKTSGTIDSSLFMAAADAGISERLIMNLAGIFAWDIDFVLDIRQGDSFSLIYEELWRDGERVGEGEILAAEFINQGEPFRAVRFDVPDGRTDYFNEDGRSMRKAFLRAPLSFTRISSNFNPRRRHPKLNTIRAHKGVDYAAPTGTPVKAAGAGKITFRGTKGGYGNTVILQHGGNVTTLYAHLSKFSGRKSGSRVGQGDVIGYVGSTGLATGPHLHYEYRRNGVHLNPRTVKLPNAEPLDPSHREAFAAVAQPLLSQFDDPPAVLAAKTADAGR